MRLLGLLLLMAFVNVRAQAQVVCPAPPHASYQGRLQPGGPVQPGVQVGHTMPLYPASAKAHSVSGSVVLRAHILEDGSVGHLTVISGPPELQVEVQKTLYQWSYTPWVLNGKPVDAYKMLTVGFALGSAGAARPPAAQKISPEALQGLLGRYYPAERSKEAKKADVTGTVKLHVVLDETGRIADLGVLCGPELLEDAALEAVRHWRYLPYLDNGEPIAVESTVDVVF